MKIKLFLSAMVITLLIFVIVRPGRSYPPTVGILSKAKNCLDCHVSNGPWRDEEKTIIDIVDKDSGRSLRQKDGTFLIKAKRGQAITVLTVIGRTKGDQAPPPYRNGWIYIDPTSIGSQSLLKFAPGWAVDVRYSCRLVGDRLEGFEGAKITALSMTVRPLDDAQESTVQLQVMLTRGESVKGDPRAGMVGNYFERIVRLKVLD